jgi:hypothetical protein
MKEWRRGGKGREGKGRGGEGRGGEGLLVNFLGMEWWLAEHRFLWVR